MSTVISTPAAGWSGARHLRRHVAALLDAIRTQGGEWTTSRAHELLREEFDVPKMTTARGALRTLQLLGWLDEHTDETGRRYFLLNASKDNR